MAECCKTNGFQNQDDIGSRKRKRLSDPSQDTICEIATSIANSHCPHIIILSDDQGSTKSMDLNIFKWPKQELAKNGLEPPTLDYSQQNAKYDDDFEWDANYGEHNDCQTNCTLQPTTDIDNQKQKQKLTMMDELEMKAIDITCSIQSQVINQKLPHKPGPLQYLSRKLAKRNLLQGHYTLCIDGRDWVLPCRRYDVFLPNVHEIYGSFLHATCSQQNCEIDQDHDKMLHLLQQGTFSKCRSCTSPILPTISLMDKLPRLHNKAMRHAVSELSRAPLIILVGDNIQEHPLYSMMVGKSKGRIVKHPNIVWFKTEDDTLDDESESNVNMDGETFPGHYIYGDIDKNLYSLMRLI